MIGLFCTRALVRRLYSAKETYHFKEPANRSHPIALTFEKIRQTIVVKEVRERHTAHFSIDCIFSKVTVAFFWRNHGKYYRQYSHSTLPSTSLTLKKKYVCALLNIFIHIYIHTLYICICIYMYIHVSVRVYIYTYIFPV